jgi:uncharacterized MAPEG superfamily protein
LCCERYSIVTRRGAALSQRHHNQIPFFSVPVTITMQLLGGLYSKIVEPNLKDVPLMYSAEGCLVAAFLMIYLSKFIHVIVTVLLKGKYDNVQASFRYDSKSGDKKSWKDLAVQRAYSAHQNMWEAFIGFAFAMILALQYAPQNQREVITRLGNAFLCVRLLYNIVYVLAFNMPLSAVRSGVWALGFAITLQLLALAVPDISYKA